MEETQQLEVIMVALDSLIPSPYQTRRFGAEAELLDLAESIKAQGVIQPIVVRAIGDASRGEFEIVAGERRVRASRLAGKAEIPAIVRDLDDHGAAEVTATENMGREDLTPLEEARAVRILLELYAGDYQRVADRCGRPASWVARRERLADLSPLWQLVLEGDVDEAVSALSTGDRWINDRLSYSIGRARHLGVTVLEELAVVPHAAQDTVLQSLAGQYGGHGIDAESVRNAIGRMQSDLGSAPWDRDDVQLVPEAGACSSCPKRTGASALLFPELAEAGEDHCMDRECWDGKRVAHIRATVEAAKAAAPEVVFLSGYGAGDFTRDKVDIGARILYPQQVEKLKVKKGKEPPEGAILAVTESGDRQWVKKRDDRIYDSRPKAADMTLSEKVKASEERLLRKRLRVVLDALAEQLGFYPHPKVKADGRKPMPRPRHVGADLLLPALSVFGTPIHNNTYGADGGDPLRGWTAYADGKIPPRTPSWERFEGHLADPGEMLDQVWASLLNTFQGRLRFDSHVDAKWMQGEIRSIADFCGIEHSELAAAGDAVRESKSLIALREELKAEKSAKLKMAKKENIAPADPSATERAKKRVAKRKADAASVSAPA